MVAHDYFQPPLIDPEGQASASTPATPPQPPRRRFRGGIAAGALALALLGGAGSGALTTSLLQHNQSARTTSSTGTTTSPVSSTSTTAATGNAQAVYQAVSPGVVTVNAAVTERFGAQGQATGSGIVLDSNGDILTNDHVIAGSTSVSVTLSDGTTATASVVGTNSSYDLAVLRISVSSSKLHPVTLGNSNNVQVGDTVYAIGAPFGLSGTLTEGIVSGTNRSGSSITSNSSIGGSLNSLIQTDTPINPGNSGGALVNTQGQVIGITQSIESPVDGSVGVGFAIPSNQVQQLLSSLEGGSNL
jgi:S1-C subfamily serine protease